MAGRKNPFIALFLNFLINVGTPAFFFIQICFFTIIWIGERTFKIIVAAAKITWSTIGFTFWLVTKVSGFLALYLLEFFRLIDKKTEDLLVLSSKLRKSQLLFKKAI